MINPILGWAERSQLHKHCVSRVKSHLKRTCDNADKEQGLVSGRITDAWGYNRGEKTWFLCEIKVNIKDLQKGVTQIHDTCFRFKVSNQGDKVIPVLAIPNKLYNEMRKYEPGQWSSFSSLCKNTDIAVWVVEQSNIRQIQGPKPTTPKPKATTKVKATAKPKAATKAKATAKSKITAKASATAKTTATKKPALKNIVAKKTAKRG